MNSIADSTIDKIKEAFESSFAECLIKKTKGEFKSELKTKLTDILVKILGEDGYIDVIESEQIRSQILILFENSDNCSETNNSILEHTGLMGKIDSAKLKDLKFSDKQIKSFENTLSKLNEIVKHIDNITNMYNAVQGQDNYDLYINSVTASALDEIGLIVSYVPYVGQFLSFEMDLLKRLFEIESDLIKSHLEQINEADEALEEVLNPNNNISDEERSNKIKEFMNSNTYKGVGKIPPETYSEGEFSEQTKSLVDIIREENPEVWEEFKNSSAYKEYEKNTSRAQEAQNDFRESENQAKNCLNNGGALGDNPNEDNEDNPFSPGNNNTDNGNDDKYNSDSSSSSSEGEYKWWQFWKWWDFKNDDAAGTNKDSYNNAGTSKSPLILDLDSDGIETSAIENGTYFDFDANKFSEKTAWVNADDGILVRDINKNGQIDNGQELFGDNTLLSTGEKAANGFEALIDLDENVDGKIDKTDSIYNELYVWRDINQNGQTDDGELTDLEKLGIESISLDYSSDAFTDEQGNEHRQLSQFTKTDGTTASINDVWFNVDNLFTVAKELLEETEDVAALPDFKGYGNVYSLHQAMLRNDDLKALVTEFTNEGSEEKRKELLLDIIYTWTGVIDVDPESRACNRSGYGNEIGDARKLEALEEFFGKEYVGTWCWDEKDPNPHGKAAPILLEVFDNIANLIYADLMVQSHYAKYFEDVTVYVKDDVFSIDLSSVPQKLYEDMQLQEDGGKTLLEEFSAVLSISKIMENADMEEFISFFDQIDIGYSTYIIGAGKNKIVGSEGDDKLTGTSLADFILSDKKHKDALRDYPFNFSDLIVLGDIYEKSVRFMISGME